MKLLKFIVLSLLTAVLVSCDGKNSEMHKLIPNNVAGVICLNMPNIVEKSGIKQGDDLVIPSDLKEILKSNEESQLVKFVKALPNIGLEMKEKAYFFFPENSFGVVGLFAVNDEDKAKKLISHRTGEQFDDQDGIDCITSGHDFWAIDYGVLFYGKLINADDYRNAPKWAMSILEYEGKNVTEEAFAKHLPSSEKEIAACFDAQKIGGIMKSNPIISTWAKDYPIMHLLLNNDMEGIAVDMAFNGAEGNINVDFMTDEGSAFAMMLDGLLKEPSNTFLQTVPNTMEMVMSMSVDGEKFVKLPQVRQMIRKVNEMPFLGRLSLDSIVGAITGPISIGVSEDPYFEGDYNYVFSAESHNPLLIVDMVSRFATSVGQEPDIYEGVYYYSYNNKQVKMGIADNVVYVKMLNYEQTEDNADKDAELADFFAKSNLGFYTKINDKKVKSSISLGMTDKRKMTGVFKTEDGNNAMRQFLKLLCSIAPIDEYDYDMSESVERNNMVGEFHAF